MPKINLFSTFFKCSDKKRQKELDYCHEKNKANPLIDAIKLFDGRPHYSDFFKETEKYPDDINILANADIYFNQTIEYLKYLQQGQAFAITRWEEVDGKIIKFEQRNAYNRQAQAKHSQDVWVFKGIAKVPGGNFYIGVPGCDNRIAWEMSRRYQVFNPCETVQCVHYHKDAKREYNIPGDSIKQIPQPWKWIEPCGIDNQGRILASSVVGRRAI